MEENLLAMILISVVGAFCIIASILNWNRFFEDRKATIFVKLFGRNGARIFYGLLGVAMIFIGIMIGMK